METKESTNKISFLDHSQPLSEIAKPCRLPIVVKYDKEQEVDPQLISSEFDSGSSLLLHSTRALRRVHGRCAHFDSKSKRFEDSGLDVAVDGEYQGWFAVFGDPTDHSGDPVVPHYRKVSQLAISPCTQFLVSGNSPLEAMKLVRMANGGKALKPFPVQPGTLLTKDGMYKIASKVKVKKSLLKKKVTKQEQMYLSCHDTDNNEIMVPCNAQGVFYVINQSSIPIRIPVTKMADIASRYTFPVLVKLVHGITPMMPSACKGTFVLLKSNSTKVCLAASSSTPRTAFFEIDADTSLRFFSSKDTLNFVQGDSFSDIFQQCCDQENALFKTIRYPGDDQCSGSARSSSTSGHGSEFSSDGDSVNWSKINIVINSRLIEPTTSGFIENMFLFTHHTCDPALESSRRQKSKSKDKKVTIQAKTIQRTSTFDSPQVKTSGDIPITVRPTSAGSSRESDGSIGRNDTDGPNDVFSTTPSSTQADRLARNEYGQVWSDSSSDISGESVDIIVENITKKTHLSESIEFENADASERKSMTTQSRENHYVNTQHDDFADDGNVYESAYDYPTYKASTIRHRENSYLEVIESEEDRTALRSSGASLTGSNTTTSPATSSTYISSDDYHYYHSAYSQTLTPVRTGTYDVPRSIRVGKKQPSVEETTVDTEADLIDYEVPVSAFQNHYERVGSVFDSKASYVQPCHNFASKFSDTNTSVTVREQPAYVNLSNSASDSFKISDPNERNSTYVLPTTNSANSNSNEQSDTDVKSKQPTYVNLQSPSKIAAPNNSGLDNLISSMKHLGLKPATEEAIRSIDIDKLESNPENMSLRHQLEELLPTVSRVDLNKVSFFLEGNTAMKT